MDLTYFLITPQVKSQLSMELFEKKVLEIKKSFSSLPTQSDMYQFLMDLGRKLPPFPQDRKIPENIVSGCQSTIYLHTKLIDDHIFFEATADALISAGLVALLMLAYN